MSRLAWSRWDDRNAAHDVAQTYGLHGVEVVATMPAPTRIRD
jgi:hypothetical protein